MQDAAILDLVAQSLEQGKLIPVPGKPGRVYWPISQRQADKSRKYVGLKETTEARAKAWMQIAEAGKAAASVLSQAASTGSPAPSPLTVKENPMRRDQDFWFAQYTPDPFGPEAFIPVARRNPRGGVAGAKEAMALYHSGRASSLKEAWAMIKAGARSNPRKPAAKAKPKAAPRKPSDWSSIFGKIGSRAAQIQQERGCHWRSAWDQAKRELSIDYTPKPKVSKKALAASNPAGAKEAMALYHSGQASSLKEAWAMVKRQGRRNPHADHHAAYEQWIGQFGTSEAWTQGIVPVNRRNPRR